MRPIPLHPRTLILLVATAGCFREKPVYVPPPPNGLPNAPVVTLGPEGARRGDDVVVTIATPSVDPEGAEVTYRYAWYQGSIPRPEFTGDTLPGSETTKGQVWRVAVTPNDGEDDGEAGTAELTIGNTPPEVTIALFPESPTIADDLRVEVERFDADGDPVSVRYAWTVDGAATDEDGDTVRASALARGQRWAVTVTPLDTDDVGTPVSAEVVVGNTPPTMRSVTLSPASPTVTDAVVAEATARDDDGDAVTFLYRWFVDGAEVQWSASDTLRTGRYAKHEQIYVEVTPNDGFEDGEPMDSDVVEVVNSAPSGTSVELSPDPAYEASTLRCSPSGFSDADRDDEDWTYAWAVDGVTVGTTATLDGSSFDKGDRVTCRATPFDGEESGPSLLSAALTVSNTAPSIGGAVLSTTTPTKNDTVAVTVTGAADDDGDGISYRYAWYVGGVEVGTAATLDGSRFSRGDVLYVVVTPFDGETTGASVTSRAAVAANAPPEIASVVLSPSDVGTDGTLTASVTATDADGDSVSYRYEWFVGGVSLGASASASTLAGATWFDRDDTVEVSVTPYDGTDYGAAALSSGVVVANTAPGAAEIAISPGGPDAGDDLTCAVVTESVDPDGDAVNYRFAWERNGVRYTGASDSVLESIVDGSAVVNGDEWTCTVTADDGSDGTDSEESVVVGLAPVFPASSYWGPLLQGGSPMGDLLGDGLSSGRELVGTHAFPAAYVYADGADFFFRLRLDASPMGAGGAGDLASFAWGILIDTDADLSSYEYILSVDGRDDAIYFSENTSPGTAGDPSDTAETILSGFPIALDPSVSPNFQVSAADSSFNGDADYFLDVAVSEDALLAVLGTGAVRFVAGSSSTSSALSIDVVGCDDRTGCTLGTAASDPMYLDGTPE